MQRYKEGEICAPVVDRKKAKAPQLEGIQKNFASFCWLKFGTVAYDTFDFETNNRNGCNNIYFRVYFSENTLKISTCQFIA